MPIIVLVLVLVLDIASVFTPFKILLASLVFIKMLGFYVSIEGGPYPESDGTDHRVGRLETGGETRLTVGGPDPAGDILDLPAGGGGTPAPLIEGVRFVTGMEP